MLNRQNELNKWLTEITANNNLKICALAGDASFRRYYRIEHNNLTKIVMDAPPSHESLDAFIYVSKLLKDAGINTPTIYNVNKDLGFITLDDFGDKLLLNELTAENTDYLYAKAIDSIITLQNSSTENLPNFNTKYVLQELELFNTWFLQKYLGLQLSPKEQIMIADCFNFLAAEIKRQPQAFIHRDFHSRNLMILDNNELGVIDFQDAMVGPLTYDLASLIKDCYIKLPDDCLLRLMSMFYEKKDLARHWSFNEFKSAVDICGMQRHMKVLGIFCRLSFRDNKHGYLKDLPLTLEYVMEVLQTQNQLFELENFMNKRVLPLFLKRHQL